MRIPDNTMEKLLLRGGTVTAEQINTLKEEGSHTKRSLQELAVQNDLITDDALVKSFAEYAQIPYTEVKAHDIPSDVLEKIPERIARQ